MARRKIGSIPARLVGREWSDTFERFIPVFEYDGPGPIDKPGFIYVFRAACYYKIGACAGDIKERLKQLAVGCPFEMTIVYSFPCNHMPSAEAEIHRLFRDNHVRGEWFKLNALDLKWLCAIKSVVKDTILEMQDGFPRHPRNQEWLQKEQI